MKPIQEIPIQIKNQQVLLNLIAEGYKSPSKALMEYIDNSFDSADDFFNENEKYNRDVKIVIEINRVDRKISIKDNCGGMDIEILKGLADSINDSEKKRREQKRPWINGKFGLGAHAFRFFAQKLMITSKQKGSNQIALLIDRDSPNAELMQSEDKRDDKNLESSGTLVEILEIDNTHLKNLNGDELKKEIETYFEMLMRRNVEITVVDGILKAICVPFNYEEINGIDIKKEIVTWWSGSAERTVPINNGIKVNLKISANKIDRPPFFSRKGRKINFIANMDSFIRKTQHRKKVWENYYLTGYIEVGDNLEPVIARDDFEGGKGHSLTRSGIYEEIVKLEDEIHDAIEKINKDRSDENLKSLASVLTNFLTEISKEDEIKLRYENKSGKENKGEWVKVSPSEDTEEIYKVNKRNGSNPHKKGEKRIIKATPNNNSDLFGQKTENEKEGIRIDFNTLQVEASDKRSAYGDGVITIFANHPDFISRRGNNDLEQTRITPRLSTYLAAVISSEYKAVFYQLKKLEPQLSSKKILEEQIDFIFRFEQKMKDLINQPIDSLGNIVN